MDDDLSGLCSYLGNEHAQGLSGFFYASLGSYETVGVGVDFADFRPRENCLIHKRIVNAQLRVLFGMQLVCDGNQVQQVLLGQDCVHDPADDEVVKVIGLQFRCWTRSPAVARPGFAGVVRWAVGVYLVKGHRFTALAAFEQAVQRGLGGCFGSHCRLFLLVDGAASGALSISYVNSILNPDLL